MEPVVVHRRKHLFREFQRGTFTRTVSPLPSVEITRTCSQRSAFSAAAELLDGAGFAGAAPP